MSAESLKRRSALFCPGRYRGLSGSLPNRKAIESGRGFTFLKLAPSRTSRQQCRIFRSSEPKHRLRQTLINNSHLAMSILSPPDRERNESSWISK